MKKCIFFVMLCMLLCLLWGCGEKTEPVAAVAPVYLNLNRDAVVTPDDSGVYTLRFLVEAEEKTFTLTDEAVLSRLQLWDVCGLKLEGDRIVDIIPVADLPYQRLASDHYVQSIGGNTVKMNAQATFVGKESVLKLTDGLKIYDITAQGEGFCQPTQLQKNDRITVLADSQGNMLYGYVTGRPAVAHEGLVYCTHCDSEVQWQDWVSASSLPVTAGHYILQTDVAVKRDSRVSGGSICLDLNGKTVSQQTFGQRIYYLAGATTLSIMDTPGGGKFLPASSDETVPNRSGMGIMMAEDAVVLNIYGGTFDGSETTSQTGCVISVSYGMFNFYDGTILGGTAYGTGSTAITATAYFNMYGGKVVGGKHICTDYAPLNPPGGGAIRVLGTTTIYGGIIEGGETYTHGGVIRMTPDAAESGIVNLILKGGTITGGKAPVGGGIYAKAGTVLEVSGDVKVLGNENGNVFLEDGATLMVGEEGLKEGAQIGISMEGTGTFLQEAPAGVDMTQFFFSDDSAKKIAKNSDGSWSLK